MLYRMEKSEQLVFSFEGVRLPCVAGPNCHVCGKAMSGKQIRLGTVHCSRKCISLCPEYREKMSRAIKALWEDPEYREKCSKTRSRPEIREMRSRAAKDRWKDPEYREKMSKSMWKDPEYRENMSKMSKSMWEDPEHRENMSQAQKTIWKDPEHREKMSEAMKGSCQSPTSIEITMAKELKAQGIDFEQEYPIDGFRIDFALPEIKLAVECDGDYWHSLPGIKEKDKRRDKVLSKLGWTTLRFTETEIKRSASNCIQIVEEALKEASCSQ